MFSLHSVLFIALDVVKGPYLHCCAPVNPFECAADRTKSGDTHDDDSDKKKKKMSDKMCCERRTSGYAATAVSRLGGFSDVFVPRSEFCRRVMYLIEAESGLLYLFYPEEIAGLHYQRKTLRYTLCLVFRVDTRLVTANTALLERIVRPYGVVLTGIMEELHKVELMYSYVSNGLRPISSPLFPPLSSSTMRGVKQEVEPMTEYDSEAQPACVDAVAMGASGSAYLTGGGVLNTSKPLPLLVNTLSSTTTNSTNYGSNYLNSSSSQLANVSAYSMQTSSPLLMADDLASTMSKGATRVNVFLTPLQDPAALQWTPLENMVETLYACLSSEEQEGSTRMTAATGSPKLREIGQRTASLEERGSQQQEEKDVALKGRRLSLRLSQTHSYHVCRIPQQCALPCHGLSDVPIPIASCPPEMEWTDMVIRDVFKAVDGNRSIAGIIQILATGDPPFDEEAQRHLRFMSPLTSPYMALPTFHTPPQPQSPSVRSTTEGLAANFCSRSVNAIQTAAVGVHLSNHPADTRLASPRSFGSRSAVSFSVAAPKGQNSSLQQLPRTPHERMAEDAGKSVSEENPCLAELEPIVLEALQHLEVYNYVRIVRPCYLHTTYNTTTALYRLMRDRRHPARRVIGRRMLLVEDKVYCLRKRQLQARQQCRQGQQAQQQRPKGGTGGKCGGASVDSCMVTLPAVLLTHATHDPQATKEEANRPKPREQQLEDGAVPTFLLSAGNALQSPPPDFSPSEIVSATNDATSDYLSEVDDFVVSEMTYTDADVDAAAAAALCALGKFTYNTIANVQREMRRIPVWSTAFASWEETCCKALVKIALLNDWLVEVEVSGARSSPTQL